MAVEKIVKIIGGKCWVEIVLFLTCPPTQDHRWQKYNKVKFDFTSSTECSSTELRHFPSRLNPTMYVVCVVLVTWTLSNLQVFRPLESDIFGWQKSESIKMLASFETIGPADQTPDVISHLVQRLQKVDSRALQFVSMLHWRLEELHCVVHFEYLTSNHCTV